MNTVLTILLIGFIIFGCIFLKIRKKQAASRDDRKAEEKDER